jgi:membrane-bound metal-dependent hydrolase YbcI (DUF457 family)
MIAPTHALYGATFSLIVLAVFGVQESVHWSLILVGILGALCPDLDMPTSTIGRLFPFVSKPLERRFGHRSVTHSLLGWGIATLVFALLLGGTFLGLKLVTSRSIGLVASGLAWWLAEIQAATMLRLIMSFSVGYLSHIVLDMITPRGVQLLWPNPKRDVVFRGTQLTVETGSVREWGVVGIGVVLLVVALPLSEHGLMTTVRWLLATPDAAIAEFKHSRYRTYVSFEGLWTQSKEPVLGTAEILDVVNKRLVIAYRPSTSEQAPPSAPPPPATRQRSGLQFQASGSAEPHAVSPTRADIGSEKPTPLHIVTLSDELSADIIATKVRLKTTTIPVVQRQLTFTNASRDSLLAQLSEDSLVSGTITLPKDLRVLSIPTQEVPSSAPPNPISESAPLDSGHTAAPTQPSHSPTISDSTRPLDTHWHPISQQGNILTLHFATKAQLTALQLDDAWEVLKKESILKRQRLHQKEKDLRQQRKQLLAQSDGLTPLGRQMLGNDEDRLKRDAKLATLDQELLEVRFQLEQIEAVEAQRILVFSGRVWVRENKEMVQ